MKILVGTLKGGAGKSTSVIGAAALAMERGVICTVIDADRQKTNGRFFARNTGVDYDGQDLQCGSLFITGDTGAYDNPGLVLVDCTPAMLTNLGELPTADLVLIAIDGQWAADGAITTIQEIKRTRPGTRMVIWVNKHYDSKFGKAELKQVAEQFGVELYKFPISASENFKRSELMSVPVWKVPYAPRSIGVQNFKLFCSWIVDGCSPLGTYSPDDDVRRSEFSAYQTKRKSHA